MQNSGQPAGPPPGWYADPYAPGTLRYWNGAAWTEHTSPGSHPLPAATPRAPYTNMPYGYPTDLAQTTIRRISDYSRLSGIFWIVLGAIQILLVATAIAGIWNVFAGISRIRQAPRIAARDARIPVEWQGIAGLVIIGVVNLVLGGIVGLILVGVDFFVRDQILKNRHLFNVTSPPAPLPAQSYGIATTPTIQ